MCKGLREADRADVIIVIGEKYTTGRASCNYKCRVAPVIALIPGIEHQAKSLLGDSFGVRYSDS